MHTYLGIVGIACLVASAWLFGRRFALALRGVTAPGRIESYEERTLDDSTSYFPVVSFRDADGRRHHFTAVAGREEPKPPVGTGVTVVYRRDDPSRAMIVSFLQMWAAPLAFAVMGLAALWGWWQG